LTIANRVARRDSVSVPSPVWTTAAAQLAQQRAALQDEVAVALRTQAALHHPAAVARIPVRLRTAAHPRIAVHLQRPRTAARLQTLHTFVVPRDDVAPQVPPTGKPNPECPAVAAV